MQRRLVAPARDHVPVKGVVAGVELAALEPPVERRSGVVKHLPRWGDPVDPTGRLSPEAFRVFDAAPMGPCVVAVRHGTIIVHRARSGQTASPAMRRTVTVMR